MHTYGTPGGSVGGGDDPGRWAGAGAVEHGRAGEVEVAKLLAATFARDPDAHVFHDLRIPGCQANVDHAVVTGSRVLLLDAKRWKPGFYWTLGGKTRRGTERIEWADSQTMPMAQRIIGEAVARAAKAEPALERVTVSSGLLVVPSGKGKLRMWAYRAADGIAVKVVGAGTGRWVKARVRGRGKADPALIRLLHSMVIDKSAVVAHGQVGPRAGT
jgi:hypothetical protein